MRIATWNIQCGVGVDGFFDLERIAARLQQLWQPDLICLQEVARFMPEPDGGAGEDQVDLLLAQFSGYEPAFGPAIDRFDAVRRRRWQFGNLVLSRRPLLQVFRHPLPQPAAPDIKHMPRQATEVVVDTAAGPLRVVTTHLEYHSPEQRLAQVDHVRRLQREVAENRRRPPAAFDAPPYAAAPRPESTVICGDFNATPGDAGYAAMVAPGGGDGHALADAWLIRHGSAPHQATCGVHDRDLWPQGPHCRDYFFVTADVAARIEALEVDADSQASDHQPLCLELSE